DCQRGPLALKCLTTSGLKRIDTGILVGAFCGPRLPTSRSSWPGFRSFNLKPSGNLVAFAKSALVHSGLSSSKTGGLAFRGMTSHFLCMGTSKADRPVPLAANSEDQTMRDPVDESIGAIPRYRAYGYIDGVAHCLIFTVRGERYRPISLRRAHAKEMRRHASKS